MQKKPRIFRCYHLNDRFGRATIAERVSMQNHNHCMQCKKNSIDSLIAHTCMHRMLIKAIGCVICVIEFVC